MITGIGCAVILGLVALYQTIMAGAYRRIAIKSLARERSDMEARRATIRLLDLESRRLGAIAAILPLHHAAAARGDARQCNALLAGAIAAGNAMIEDPAIARSKFLDGN